MNIDEFDQKQERLQDHMHGLSAQKATVPINFTAGILVQSMDKI